VGTRARKTTTIATQFPIVVGLLSCLPIATSMHELDGAGEFEERYDQQA
jgi:hypothetical protein